MLLIQEIASRLILGNYLFSYSELLHFGLVVDALVKSEQTTYPFHSELNTNVFWKAIVWDGVGFSRPGFISCSFPNSLFICGQIIFLV